jgi:transcriptional regulator with XRE-family HTH domain
MFVNQQLTGYPLAVASYGENAEALRRARNLTQEDVRKAMGLQKPSFVTVLEGYRGPRIPTPDTIRRHAEALGVYPADLLAGVETEIDALRAGPSLSPPPSTNGTPAKDGAGASRTRGKKKAKDQRRLLSSVEDHLRSAIDDLRSVLDQLPNEEVEQRRKKG